MNNQFAKLFRKDGNSLHSDVQAQHIQDIPNNNTLSSLPPPSSPLKDIPRNILAFRTITTLLSQLQPEREFEGPTPKVGFSAAEQEELRISSALATVAVINHEVVAVVTKPFSPQKPDTLEITACIQGDTSIKESRFMVATNWFNWNSPRTDLQPTITNASAPAGLKQLVNIISRSGFLRNRAKSTGSQRLSSDSINRPNINNVKLLIGQF